MLTEKQQEKRRKYMKTYKRPHPIPKSYWKTPEMRARRRNWNREIRKKVLIHYGGNPPKCACCKEKHIEFLVIDHVNGGGLRHRIKVLGGSVLDKNGNNNWRSSMQFYRWLIRNNFPTNPPLQVLCHNCNNANGFYGYCPHKRRG